MNAAFTGLGNRVSDLLGFHGGQDKYINHLLKPPEVRLESFLDDVQRVARDDTRVDEILVFGHTHKPFISSKGNLVNTGSWVEDAAIKNTFVELDGVDAKLFVFEDAQHITEIVEKLVLD